jgi:hypothetical protein
MFGLTLDEAKTIGAVVAVVLVLAAVGAFWLMRTIVQKLVAVGVLALLAFAVWTQRESLQDCADKVQAGYQRVGTDVTLADTDCSFFGFTITISDPDSDTDEVPEPDAEPDPASDTE